MENVDVYTIVSDYILCRHITALRKNLVQIGVLYAQECSFFVKLDTVLPWTCSRWRIIAKICTFSPIIYGTVIDIM